MTVKKIAAILLAASVLLGACAPKKVDPPKPKPTVDAKYAEVCIDIGTFVRRPDFWCEPLVDGHRWAYPINNADWATYELPAVGEPLVAGWGFPIKPSDAAPVRIPEEDAIFKR